MVNVLYSVMALVSAAVMILINQYTSTDETDKTKKRAYRILIWVSVAFTAADAFWGALGSRTFDLGVEGFFVSSMMFHFMAIITPCVWFRYVANYLSVKINYIGAIFAIIPALLEIALLSTNPFTGWIFTIDSGYNYASGQYRMILFIVQLMYFLAGLIISVIAMLSASDSYKKSRYNTSIVTMIIPMAFGVFQLWFPDAPYYSIGYMLSMIVMMTGNISIEREHLLKNKSQQYMDESREIYRALETLANNFVSIHLFDLTLNKQHMVHSNPQIEQFVDRNDPANVQIRKVMEGVCDPEYTQRVVEFVDTLTLPERMKGKNILTVEFVGKNLGWCVSSFFKVEEDENGYATKVIHAVQNINEAKMKEKEYEKTLKAALQNENYIYVELLKMQDNGVVATDLNSRVVVLNDKMKHMYNLATGTDAEPHTLDDLLGVITFDNIDEAREEFEKIKIYGGNYNFNFSVTCASGRIVYCMSSTKRIESMDGRSYLITSITDITKNKLMENMLLVLSETDALTNISNRGSGEAKITTLLEEGKEGVFCVLDINKFKSINDTYGHQAGDVTLIAMADALKESFRESDVIMRLGGDEFAVFAVGINEEQAVETVLKRFYDCVERIDIEEINNNRVTVSLGVVFSKDDEEKSFDSLYRKADKAMYECKKNDMETFVYYSE